MAAALPMLGWDPALGAGLPQGGTVSSGHASINSPSAGQMVVDQTTQAAVINWQSFDIGAGDSVRFVQPDASSVTLNRVVGADPSTILGELTANGAIFLVNPNGVLFAPGASVSVGGIVASTLGISDASFLSGNYHFSGGGHGAVVNQGSITAAHGGYVALIGPSVSNEGTIAAAGGAAALGAGATVDMTLAGNTLETFKVSAAALDAQVSNGGAIRAAGGQVILSAQAMNTLLQTVVNNTGVISADSAVDNGGTITLLGSGGAVQAGGQISASSQRAAGGSVAISGNSVAVDAGTQIVASGASAGGSIAVGGDLHGGSLPLAATTAVDAGAVFNASATVKGDGGSIQVVSDTSNAASTTVVSGTLIAEGGSQGGDGGKIETSGSTLDTAGITVRAGAPKGEAGQWLLDPTMIEIGTTNSGTTSSTSGGTTTYTGTGTSDVSASTIDTALNSGTNVTVQTSGLANSGAFDIWVISPIEKTSGGTATLTLQAANSVYVGAPISSTSGALNVNLYAGDNAGTLTGTGAVLLASDITTDGGNINFGTDRTFTFANGVTQLAGGDVYVDSQLTTSAGGGSTTNQLVTLDTTSSIGSGGNVNIYGQTVIANPAGLEINTQHKGSTGSDGNVYFAGTVDSGNTFTLVPGSYSWNVAYDDAQSGTGANVGDTYLATPSTSLLNAVASFDANYGAAWLGGERLVASTPTGTPSSSNTTSLDNLWYWVAGPLGLVVNPSSPTGYGKAFFTEFGSTTQNGQSGTPINGAYTNWNPGTALGSGNLGTAGEPNNDGGANLTPSGAGEWTLQFVGTAGQWNDLNPTNNSLPYVKETNLAAASLIVNSGQGTITLGAGVGTNAPLESFNATGNVIDLPQNPAIDTTGGTTINGQVQVFNGSTYTPTTLLTIAGTSGTSTYGSSPPAALPITYTVQGQASSSAPPADVGTASEAWSTTPTSTSNVGIYDSTVSGASCSSCGYTILYVNGALTIEPATVSVSGVTGASRSYNGTTTVALSGTATLSGLLNGNTGTPTGSPTGTVGSPNVQLVAGVAQPQAVTTDFGFTLTSGDPSDYTFVQPSLTATILPAPLTVSGLSPVSHTYNGSTTVALSGTPVFTGLVGSQTVTIGNLSAGGEAGSANAGMQTVTGQVQLANGTNGGLASNYALSVQPTLANVTITPAPLTVSGLSPVNYTYDDSTTVALSGTPVLAGLIGSQTLTIDNLSTGGEAGSANAGMQTVTGQVQLANGANGGLASNYALTQPTLADVTISPAPVTVSGLSPVNYIYNGSTAVALTGTPVFTGLVGSQTVTIGNLSAGGQAGSANAGAQAVTGQVQLANGTNGGLASNYALSVQPALSNVTISPAPVTVSGLSPVDYTYDGATTVALSGTPVFAGLVGSQTLTIGNLSTGGVAGSANAGAQGVTGQVQLANGTNGGLASNYALSVQPTLSNVTISPAPVTVSGLIPVNYTYDGSTTVALSGTPVLTGLVGSQTLTIGNLSAGGEAGSANAGVQGVTGQVQLANGANGGLASNYALTQPTLADVTISPAPVTVSGLSPVNYIYNGSTTVALTGTPVFTGLVGSQTLTIGNLSAGGEAGSANAGVQGVTGQVQLANGTNGGLASNYALSVQPALSNVTISPAPVTVSGLSPVDYTYDGATTVALSGTPVLTGLVGSQTLTIGNLSTGGVAGSANAGVQAVTGQVQLANGTNGGLASNYALSVQPALSNVTISPASVTVSGLSPVNYAYDGSTVVALTGTPVLTGLVGNQTLVIGNLSTGGVAGSANAGAQAVTGEVQLANGTNGGLASNYALSVQPTLSNVTISPASVTVSGLSPVNYTYDGSTVVALTGTPVFTGLVGNQTLVIGNLSTGGVAGSANAGTQAVTAQVQLANGMNGGLAANYALSVQPALSNVTISPAPVTVAGSIALPMTYDGSTQVAIVGAYLEGVVPGNDVTLVSNATVGAQATGATVGVTFDDSLTGPDAGNYVIAQQPQGVTVSVLPAKQTVVAPVQDGVAAPATNTADGNTSSGTVSSLAVPPLVVANASQSLTSIAVINGGVNAPASELQINGFWQTLPTTSIKQGRVAVVAR